jgi:hypothetical protein
MRVFAVLVCGQGSVTLRPSVSREVGVLDFKGLPSSESIISSARSMNSSVILWRLLEREADWLPPWRDLLRIYRRLEARGDIRGGRFVSDAGRRLDQQFLEGDRQPSGEAETNVVKQVMAPGALDPLTKELVYIAENRRPHGLSLARRGCRGRSA